MPKYISNTSCTNVYTVSFLNMLADSIFYYMPIAFSKLDDRCLDPMSDFTLPINPSNFNDKSKPLPSFPYSLNLMKTTFMQRTFKSLAWIQVKEQQ